ncbi:hypothetical protein CC78DRAFT_385343 [Lojkania enalia]|uniref:Uncharacterized protein n=1 Tax=Lojkania enalia TaxID=147567 RepID=A0A9P4K615_9PLEO|nr:hypothetical protein CC78DRAFT_385343 [Didymosphaeria enalia]
MNGHFLVFSFLQTTICIYARLFPLFSIIGRKVAERMCRAEPVRGPRHGRIECLGTLMSHVPSDVDFIPGPNFGSHHFTMVAWRTARCTFQVLCLARHYTLFTFCFPSFLFLRHNGWKSHYHFFISYVRCLLRVPFVFLGYDDMFMTDGTGIL